MFWMYFAFHGPTAVPIYLATSGSMPGSRWRSQGKRNTSPDFGLSVDYGGPVMKWSWRELLALSFFVALFCAALIANVSDSSMLGVRGAWLTQAMR
jgi:hypothetical protein